MIKNCMCDVLGVMGDVALIRNQRRGLVAACLEPGVSISGLALAHGVNANLSTNFAPGFNSERLCNGRRAVTDAQQ
jgi:hypothetical protein